MNQALQKKLDKGRKSVLQNGTELRFMLCNIFDQKVTQGTYWVRLTNLSGDFIGKNGQNEWLALNEPVEVILSQYGKLDSNRHMIALLYSGPDPVNGISIIVQRPGVMRNTQEQLNQITQKGPTFVLSSKL